MTDLVQTYIKHLIRRGYASSTTTTMLAILRVYQDWFKPKEVEHATPESLETFTIWLADGRLYCGKIPKASSRANYIKNLRAFYGWLHSTNRVLTNPAADLQYPKKERRLHADVLTLQEVHRLLEQPERDDMGIRDAVMMRLLVLSGIRISALCSIRIPEVNLKRREIVTRLGKGSIDSLHFIDVETARLMAHYLTSVRPRLAVEDIPHLIIGDKGRHLAPRQAGVILERYRKQAKISKHVTPHSLRRTFATLLLHAGVNLKAVSMLMNHVRLSTTAAYQPIRTADLTAVYRSAHPFA